MVFDKYLCVFFVGCFFVDSVVKKMR